MPNLEFKEVQSSNIKAVAHDGQKLYVRFKHSKTGEDADLWWYEVPEHHLSAMLHAESVGKYFHAEIKKSGCESGKVDE